MPPDAVATVTGPVAPAALGRTLMHEHRARRVQMTAHWNPTHSSRRIVPRLLDAGVTEAAIERLLVDNPRRFFAGEPLPTRS